MYSPTFRRVPSSEASLLPVLVPVTTAVELPSDKAAVLVVVAEGRVEADADDRLLCVNTEVPPVCLGFSLWETRSLPPAGTGVEVGRSRAPKSLLARLALVKRVCEVVESCVKLSCGSTSPSWTGQKLHDVRLTSQYRSTSNLRKPAASRFETHLVAEALS